MGFKNSKGDQGSKHHDALTEAALSRSFSSLLHERAPKRAFPALSAFYPEVPGIQGIADFIGIRTKNWSATSQRLHRQFSGLPKGPCAEIVASLRRPHTYEYLLSHSRYSEVVCHRALASLIDAGLVVSRAELFHLSRLLNIPQFEIYFFELKLEKWQRALAQAIQAKAYADKVFCVFPWGRNSAHARSRLFEAMNVGVLYFDPGRMLVRESVRARKEATPIPAYRLEVLLRLASRECGTAQR